MLLGLAFRHAVLNLSNDLSWSSFTEVYFLASGSLGALEPGITVKPAATPLAEALGVAEVVMLVVVVGSVAPKVSQPLVMEEPQLHLCNKRCVPSHFILCIT